MDAEGGGWVVEIGGCAMSEFGSPATHSHAVTMKLAICKD